ncbi:hypothetical protein MMC21_006981 [Puttea exsequens]|nr:hypothetical protein [Puttea exsequens]
MHDLFQIKNDDFSTWHLTHDRGVVGVDKETLENKLQLLKKGIDDIASWDCHGIELVSRVLPLTPASFAEMATHLTALNPPFSSATHAAFTNEHCGFHVHIGLPVPADLPAGAPPPTFDLPTLQHLAYILVMYERAIGELHPRERREGSAAAMVDLQTNLDNFIEEPVWNDYDDNDNDNDNESENENENENENEEEAPDADTNAPSYTFASTRAKIFAPTTTLASLSALMCNSSKYHIVIFANLPLTPTARARTIEFRQHAGTLDAWAAEWWVRFCCGLVRFAGRMAKEYGAREEYGGEGYALKEWSGKLDVWELVEEMEFEEEGRGWLREMVSIAALG